MLVQNRSKLIKIVPEGGENFRKILDLRKCNKKALEEDIFGKQISFWVFRSYGPIQLETAPVDLTFGVQ